MEDSGRILVVDDVARNVRVLQAMLTPQGFEIVEASSGQEALDALARVQPDLVLLDIRMPGLDGFETCRRIRMEPAGQFLPIVMVTSVEDEDRVAAIEAGADDFIARPFNQQELLARVRSLVRIKHYQDTIVAQTDTLNDLNRRLEDRVRDQGTEIDRLSRLRRFLPPQLADLALSTRDPDLLATHRAEIAVLFADLEGWTSFAETTEPEEVMGVIRAFHATTGALIQQFQATVGWFAGDGVMVWFNDPFPCPVPSARAAALAVAMRDAMAQRTAVWRRRGHQLDFAIGIALGYATIGTIGFEGRYEYGAVGSVTNLASRLSDEAGAGQILMSARAFASAEDLVEGDRAPDLKLKGFAKPVMAYRVRSVKPAARAIAAPDGIPVIENKSAVRHGATGRGRDLSTG
jgi:adenylate cyclase